MPRPLRVHVPGGFYHVTLRGNHRQQIFFRPAHRRILECIVREAIARFDARVHAYCWMTNHIHLLVQVSDPPLGRIMLRIASRYARTVQAQLRTRGHLFERRYHAVLVDADAYLITLLRYIHQNPRKAGIVEALADYRWSSHHVYAGTRRASWVTSDFALGVLHRDRPTAIQSYLKLVEEAVSSDELLPHPEDKRVIGDDKFMQRVRSDYAPRMMRSLEDLMSATCAKFSVLRAELLSGSKERRLAQARAWLAHEAVTHRVASICEVARLLHRHEASIRGLLRRRRRAE
ncbi:MAG: REP-associated tyrosine transposase [Steroidobacter sp.]